MLAKAFGNDVDAVLRSRRTINNFLPDLPGDWEAKLEAALESAIYAPNHRRTEPWRFHLLGPEAVRKVCDLQERLVAAKKGPEAGRAKRDRWMRMPGWLVVTCRRSKGSTGSLEDPGGVDREDYAACCCAAHNLCLSLHDKGMGTKWTTGAVNFTEEFAGIVGFDGDEEYVVVTLWFGTPEGVPAPPVKLKGLGDILRKTD